VAHESLVHIGTPGGNLPVYDGNPVNLPAASEFAYMPSGGMGTGNRMTILALTAIQPIYAGGRISTGNELASLGVEAARLEVELSERDAVAQTEEKYWRLVALREKLRTLAAFEALLASLATQVDDGMRAGLLTNNDRLKVGLQRTQTSIDRGRVESGIRLMSQDLRRHVGLPDGDSIELADSLRPPTNPGGLRKHGQDAGESRVELRLLTQAARAEKLQADMARGEMYPSVMVGASAYRVGIEGIPTMTNAVAFGMINVPLTGIWEGAHTSSSHEKSADAANQRLAEVRALIRLEINKCWDELWTAWQMTALSELAVEQAATNLEEVSDRHRNGLVVFSDVLEAQVLRQQALDKQIDARSEYWLKRSAFLRAAGRNRS
jgi:outer membrane protein TolC